MKDFFRYAKNRILYSVFRFLFYILIVIGIAYLSSFLMIPTVHAETVEFTIIDSSITVLNDWDNHYDENVINTLISEWEENFSSSYPYYFIKYDSSKKIYNLYYSNSNQVKFTLYYSWYRLGSVNGYLQITDGEVVDKTLSPGVATSPSMISDNDKIIYYNNYIDSNFDLITPTDLSFTINEKAFSYNTENIFPTLKDIHDILYPQVPVEPDVPTDPDIPSEDEPITDTTENIDPDIIYTYLTIICILLLLPIVIKFINNMINLSGRDIT